MLTREARVTVIEGPHFRRRMSPETSGEFGKDIVLPCDVGGTPAPKWVFQSAFQSGRPFLFRTTSLTPVFHTGRDKPVGGGIRSH